MASADNPLGPPAVSPGRVREAVEEILARPEFAGAEPSLLSRAWARAGEWLGRLLEALSGTGQAGMVATLVIVAVLVGALLLAVRFASGLRVDGRPGPALAAPAAVGDRWLERAVEHERAGDWREALRCHYRGLIADLAARGLVDEAPGRTTGEYLAEGRAALPAAADALADATRTFELAWYGARPVGRDDVAALAAAAARVRAAAAAPAPSARPHPALAGAR